MGGYIEYTLYIEFTNLWNGIQLNYRSLIKKCLAKLSSSQIHWHTVEEICSVKFVYSPCWTQLSLHCPVVHPNVIHVHSISILFHYADHCHLYFNVEQVLWFSFSWIQHSQWLPLWCHVKLVSTENICKGIDWWTETKNDHEVSLWHPAPPIVWSPPHKKRKSSNNEF